MLFLEMKDLEHIKLFRCSICLMRMVMATSALRNFSTWWHSSLRSVWKQIFIYSLTSLIDCLFNTSSSHLLLNSLVYLFALSPQSPCKMLIIIGMDTGSVDMAKTMAEVFQKGDANKDEKLNKQEFINVSAMFSHKSRSRVIKHSSYKQL